MSHLNVIFGAIVFRWAWSISGQYLCSSFQGGDEARSLCSSRERQLLLLGSPILHEAPRIRFDGVCRRHYRSHLAYRSSAGSIDPKLDTHRYFSVYSTSGGVFLHNCRCMALPKETYASATQTRQLHFRFQLQTIRKGGLTMEGFITKVPVLKDALATTGETLKESEVILITLGTLGDEYEAFVSSITTRYGLVMTFASLCELLMDQEIWIQKNHLLNPVSVNAVVKFDSKKSGSPRSVSPTPKSDIRCQICNKKVHSALNCYNRLNISRFPPTHNRELSIGPQQ